MAITKISRDTFYIIHENVPKHKFLGNSWYTGMAYGFSRSHELSLSLGRTYGNAVESGGDFNVRMRSWGITYAYSWRRERATHLGGIFAEASNFFLPPVTLRLDYLYDFSHQRQYVRPSLGLCFFTFDVLYSYSFKIGEGMNNFRHSLILRLKYFINSKNWQHTFPSHY